MGDSRTTLSSDPLETLISVGMALSRGHSFPQLFRRILQATQDAADAEGGSLYIVDEKNRCLKIVVLVNRKLGMENSVDDFDPLNIEGIISVPLYDESGAARRQTVSVSAYLNRKPVLINSIAEDGGYDFAQVRRFDQEHHYETRSLLTVPLFAHDDRVIGIVQLVNAGAAGGGGADFDPAQIRFIEALSAQMGMVLNNALLVAEAENLLISVVRMVGVAIDEKSAHTSGHCRRVTLLTMMFAQAVAEIKEGKFKDFSMTDDDRRELEMSALLHDIGKIITPVHVLDKQTKLQKVFDKIELVRARFAALRLNFQLNHLRRKLREFGYEKILNDIENDGAIAEFDAQCSGDLEFLEKCNRGEIFMGGEQEQKRLAALAAIKADGAGCLLDEEDCKSLAVKRGTLNPEERKIMEEHVSISIRLLKSLPWPRDLRRVAEYAGGHHENINGSGYPNKLTGDQMSVPARILGIADRFEGLSAWDRPYRKEMPLSKVLHIMRAMESDGEIDKDLFALFLEQKVYLNYARRHMPERLIDCD